MIEGKHFKGSDVQLEMDTEIDLSLATLVTVIATFSNGPTKEYTGSVLTFSSIAVTIPSADNIYPGPILLQVTVTFPGTGKKFGEEETLYITDTPTVTA